MTYRDDHEAALARVEALELELTRERSDDADRERRMAAIESELRAARTKLERAEAALADVRHDAPAEPAPAPVTAPAEPPATGPVTPPARPLPPLVKGMLAFGVVLVFIWILAAASHDDPDSASSTPPAPPRPAVVATPDEASALLAEALERARLKLPGGRLLGIRAEGITREGALHPTFGKLTFDFQRDNPPRPDVADPDQPIGAPRDKPSLLDQWDCLIVERSPAGWMDVDLGGLCVMGDLNAGRPGLTPRCTLSAIWRRAIADGAEPSAIAAIDFVSYHWSFTIDDPRAPFSATYADDCAPPPTAERP